jgi:hypothetical protein
MFTVGDYVINQETGHLGKVIGYGNRLMNHLPGLTLKVLIIETANSQKHEFVIEAEISAWHRWCVAKSC